MEQRQLNPKEAEILDLSVEILAEGHTTTEAATMALTALPLRWTDPSFVSWLNRQGAPAN